MFLTSQNDVADDTFSVYETHKSCKQKSYRLHRLVYVNWSQRRPYEFLPWSSCKIVCVRLDKLLAVPGELKTTVDNSGDYFVKTLLLTLQSRLRSMMTSRWN